MKGHKIMNDNIDHGTQFVCLSCEFSDKNELINQCNECIKDEISYEMDMEEMYN